MSTHLTQSDLETLFYLSHDLLCLAKVDGFFHRINPSFSRVLGYDTAELLDCPFVEFVHQDDRQATLAALQELTIGRSVVSFENRYRCKDGEYKSLQWTATPDQNSEFIVATARDVSVENKLRLEAERSRSLQALGTVAATIAHDMNNILAPILSMSELLLQNPNRNGEQANRALELIHSSAVRSADLVKQIQSFSSDQPTEFSAVKIQNIVDEVVKGLASTVRVNLDVDRTVDCVRGNATQLFQVVMNLCENATQAMLPDSDLQINLYATSSFQVGDSTDDKFVVFEIINEGQPIPIETRKRIFEPFFTSRKNEGGHGLGLAIVKRIIDAHDGMISVTCNAGRTKFSIMIPAIKQESAS
ncbi:MAG: nitrogen regulation protein NR(II) [Mariniblastus sp.]